MLNVKTSQMELFIGIVDNFHDNTLLAQSFLEPKNFILSYLKNNYVVIMTSKATQHYYHQIGQNCIK